MLACTAPLQMIWCPLIIEQKVKWSHEHVTWRNIKVSKGYDNGLYVQPAGTTDTTIASLEHQHMVWNMSHSNNADNTEALAVVECSNSLTQLATNPHKLRQHTLLMARYGQGQFSLREGSDNWKESWRLATITEQTCSLFYSLVRIRLSESS